MRFLWSPTTPPWRGMPGGTARESGPHLPRKSWNVDEGSFPATGFWTGKRVIFGSCLSVLVLAGSRTLKRAYRSCTWRKGLEGLVVNDSGLRNAQAPVRRSALSSSGLSASRMQICDGLSSESGQRTWEHPPSEGWCKLR